MQTTFSNDVHTINKKMQVWKNKKIIEKYRNFLNDVIDKRQNFGESIKIKSDIHNDYLKQFG